MSKGFAFALIAATIIGGAAVVLLNLAPTPTLEPAVPLSPDPATLRRYDVVAEYPHDPQALTQGLIYRGGFSTKVPAFRVNPRSGKWNSTRSRHTANPNASETKSDSLANRG